MQTCRQHRFTFHSQHCFCLAAERQRSEEAVNCNTTATVSLETLRHNGPSRYGVGRAKLSGHVAVVPGFCGGLSDARRKKRPSGLNHE